MDSSQYRLTRGYLIGLVVGLPLGGLIAVFGHQDIVFTAGVFSQLGAWLGWAIVRGRI